MFHIKVKKWNDTDDWEPTQFPKCSEILDDLRHQAEDLAYVYHKVGIFDSKNDLQETIWRNPVET